MIEFRSANFAQSSGSSLISIVSACLFLSGCTEEVRGDENTETTDSDDGVPLEPTYWQHAAPIFYNHCIECHQVAGIASFLPLDDDAVASQWAQAIAVATANRTMPPWHATSDGSCGTFSHSLALSDQQIATLQRWNETGAQLGVPDPSLTLPPVNHLADTISYSTPEFFPVSEDSPLAPSDEYRCFLIDPQLATHRFLTGYEVFPGNPQLVHHAVVFLIDPNAIGENGKTNAELIAELDQMSPDRDGWSCYSSAGSGVEMNGVPVTWAPGQGPVAFPDNTGILINPGDLMVAQVHYNLIDPSSAGLSDSTTINLRYSDFVERQAFMLMHDEMLNSLQSETPVVLPPGQAQVPYSFDISFDEIRLPPEIPFLDIYGAFPHMHEYGTKHRIDIRQAMIAPQCAIEVKNWDFNWQRLYFYEQPFRIQSGSTIHTSCEYNTTKATQSISPGWGTQNEMCLLSLYAVLPPGVRL